MAFDVEGARRAGYTDAEIADYLAKERGFKIGDARKAGYSDAEIVGHLKATKPKPEKGTWDTIKEVAGKAYDTLDKAMQPLREAVGYDPEEQNRKTDEIARQIRDKQRADLATQDGILDTAGDLFTRGMAGASAGIERVASGLALNDAERQRFVTRARENEAIAKTGIAGETTWDSATGNLAKMPGFILEKGVESLPYMATAAVGPFGALSNAAATSGQIAQSRAEADGRQDASGKDVAIAAPFGAVSTLIDSLSLGALRNGIGSGLARGIMRDAATEGLTEAVQSGIEYTGGAVGTKQGFDLGEMGSQMLQGGLVGTGVGGGFGVVTEGTKETFDAAGRIKFRRADDTRTPGPGLREQAVADAVVLTPQDLASPLDNADLAAGKAEIAKATAGKDADTALSQAGLPKVGSKVNVTNLPGGASMSGVIEDVFTDDTGTGVVVRPEGGGSPMREYLDTLNELGVSITPPDPLAEADAIDAALAAQASAPMEVPSPLPSAGAETPSPRPSGRTPSASAGGGVNSAIVEGLKKRGFSEGQALGIAAGIHAESASNPNAKNPTSGAMGLGQWLGPRKEAIRKRFGDNPTLEQQLDFLADELRGGDAGGKYVLSQNEPAKVLDAYVRKFMRPAAGAETDGDIARGMAALGQAPTDTGPLVPESTTQYADLPEAPQQKVEVTAPAPDLPDLYHGGREGMSLDDIQIIREPGASKQGKKGRTYGGFYATEKLDEAQGYADMAEGSTVYRVQLAPGSKVETKEGDVTRLSASTIEEYRNRGVDVVVGKDPRGRTEYVVINKDAVTGLVDTKQNTAGPQDGGVAATVEAPKAGGPDATAADSAASAGGAVTPARAPIPARTEARQDVAVTATGSEMPVNYAVVEMGDLVASNTPDGGVNHAYPADRQPRDRTRAASQTQIAEIASRLNPRLLGRSPKASDGAPIISPDGIVESGNGRTLALQRVYGENGENAQAYRQFIESEGFDTSGMKQPVLVRIRDGNMSTEQVQEFVRAANVRDTAGMSGTETAGSDAAAMPAQMVDLYRGGDIEAAGNRDFVKAFVNALVPTNERASMILADGSIAKGLVARMEAALLVRAFGQRPFIEKMVDATDSNIRAIGKALVEMAGKFAKLREAAQDERVDPAMDITGNIAEAVEIIDRARREGKPIGDYVNQRDIFSGATVSQMTEAALRMFFARPDFTKPHGQAKLVSAMDFYVEEAMKAAPGGGLFGESTKATPDGILNLANERNSRTQPADADLFSAARQPGAVPDGESVPDAGRDGGLAGEGVQTVAREEGGSSSEPVEPTDSVDTPAANTPARIDDFGEQLVGARKDVWQSYKDRLNDAAEIDVTAEPLSKTWPEPDYQKLLDAGADPYVVAWVHAARDEIPTKPQKGWKLKGWAENVRLLRDTATKLLNDEIGADALVKRMSGELSRSLRDLQGRVDLYRDMGHSKSLKGITFSQNYYSLYRGERDVTKWVVEKRAKATAFGNWPREIAVGDTREEALAKFKAIYDAGNLDGNQDKIVRFDIYSRRGEPGFVIGKKIGKDYVDLKRFDTAKEARDFKISDAGYAELVAALEQYKDIPPERKAVNAPRIGIDHRSGADVTPEAFAEAFGFRGVQFGNYVEGERRQSDLNEAYDALMDLAGVIGVPARALSLNGELGLAFGARGKGGKGAAAAHFEPDTIVINLTKNKGAGSLAHEWWHSLDNYFSRMRAPGGYMTEGKITATDGVRPEMVQAFKDVMAALRSTSLKERSKNLDKRRTKEYWATDIEMSARAFESYVIAKLQDEQFSNDYLANVVSEKAFGIEDAYPYLRAAEIPVVRAAFDSFFAATETRETDRGLALFSVPEAQGANETADVRAALREQLEKLRLADKVKVRLVDTLGGAAGEYRAQIVSIAQDTPQGEVFTLNHEAIHVLRDLGLFNTSEWAILSAKAKRETGLMRSIRQRYEAGFRQRGMSGPALQEALIEEAVADMFARHQDGRYKAEGTTDRLFKMLRQFFEAVRNAFAGRGLRTAEGVMQDVAAGEVGGREVLPDIFERPLQSLPEGDADSDPTFDNSDIEARFQAAKDGVGSQITLRDRIADSMERAWHGITRHWINLPNVPEYAALQEKLRAIEAAPQAAKERTLRMLDDMVRDFSNEDLDLFTRKVILDDLFWDASNDRDLPFGFTRETLTAERAKIDQILEAQPGQKILTAVAKRKRANRIIAKELVDAGVLEAEQIKNPAYYRHQVLEYARAQMKIARGTGKRLRSPKWAKRMGSSLDINANLLEAEFDWLNKAFVDIPVARAIEWIKNSEHNILDRLRSEARESNRKGIEERVAEAQEIVDNPREYDAEDVAKATALISISRSFGRNIAMGFGKVRAALESGEVEYPARFEAVAKGIIEGTSDNQQPPFEFLTWMLDNNAPGAIGAAMIMKAVGQRRSWTKDVLGKAYVEPDSANDLIDRLAPEGYTTWQPDEGKLLFTVKTIPERVIDEMLMQMDTPKGVDPDVVRAALEGARTSMALGGAKYTMVLPEEVAATLNQLRREEVDSIGKTLVREPVRMWKQWVLINPRRFLKYNFNNLSGDLDAIIAGKPKALRRVGEAGRELYRVMKKGEKPSARYEEAVARGVFDSGLSVQEIPDIHMLEPFERFAKKPNLASKMTLLVLRKAWNGLQGFTQWREGVFRYALYLDFVDRLEAGESQASVGYGASRPDMVDAVPDLKDRAAMLARDLIGDYGAISHYGANLRETILPFWSWMEINTKRYWRLTANAYGQGVGQGLATSGGLAAWKSVQLLLRMGVLFAIISMWNNLFFDDEEDDLSEDQRRQMHMIFGRYEDGSVRTMRLQGSFSDALSWFGWQDVLAAVEEYEKGRESLVGVLLKGAKAPINKVGTSISPTITVPLESAFGRKLWPDVFNTRPLDDGWRNLFSTFSLENEYDLVMDRPSRGYARSWQESVLYRRDPGEMAYGEVRGKVYDWLEREKGQTGGGGVSTPKSQAMKDYRQALKFGDLEAARNAWDRMVELGVTENGYRAMMRRAAPLGPIAKKDRQAFVDQMTEEEYQAYLRADAWYRETFRPNEIGVRSDDEVDANGE